MATSYTTILKLALPAQGELSGSWGNVVNDNITQMIEEAIAGRKVINTWSTNSATLSTADGTTSEARAAMLAFTDTGSSLSGAATVICPAQSKIYICKNSTGQTVTIKTSSGTGVAIPNGETMFVFCDGTNVEQAVTNISSLNVDGFAFSIGGAVTTAGAFTTSGANALTLTTTGTTNVTLPTTGTLATTAGTETFTNKTLTSPAVGTALTLNAQGELRFGDSDTSNYVGFEAPATVSSNQIWVLPAADGSNGQALITNGSGTFSFGNVGGDVVDDTSPQLGGDLDVNGNSIVSTSNADINIEPNGTGDVNLKADHVQLGGANENATLTTNGTADLTINTNNNVNSGSITIFDGANGNIRVAPNGTGDFLVQADTVQVGDSNADATITTNGTGDLTLNTNSGSNSGSIAIADGANGNITITPNGSGNIVLDGLTFPNADGSANQVLQTNGSGTLSFATVSGGSGGLGSYGAVNSTGGSAQATGTEAIAIGKNAEATATNSIAIGDGADAKAQNNIAIGLNSNAGSSYAHSIALGKSATVTSSAQLMLGAPNGYTGALTSIRVGNTSYSPSNNYDLATKKYVDDNAGGGGSGGLGNYGEVNSTGTAASANGTDAIAIGEFSQASGSNDIAIGSSSLASNNAGTAVGYDSTANGFKGSAFGERANNSHNYSVCIGSQATTSAANQVMLGNSSISDLRCQDTSITAVSDSRDKVDVATLAIGLDFVETIEPKAFYKNNRGIYYDSDTGEFDQTGYDNATKKYSKKEFGFIAQDVAAALPSQYSDARVTFAEDDPLHGFNVQHFTPGDMVPILWKAVRELSAKNKALEARIEALEG